MLEWKDTTSYRRGGDKTPTTWSAKIGDLRVTVTTGHIYYPAPGQWVMHCSPFFNTHELKGAATKEAAQQMALELVKDRIDLILADMAKLDPERYAAPQRSRP